MSDYSQFLKRIRIFVILKELLYSKYEYFLIKNLISIIKIFFVKRNIIAFK